MNIETGHAVLDRLLGGGLPRGGMVEIFGDPNAGRSTLGLALIRGTGRTALIVDGQKALTPLSLEQAGLDFDRTLVLRPQHGEEAFEVMVLALEEGAAEVILVDDAVALVPGSTALQNFSAMDASDVFRLYAQGLPQLAAALRRSGGTAIFINQTRRWGRLDSTCCGRALRRYCNPRIEVLSGPPIRRDGEPIGQQVLLRTLPTSLSEPALEARLALHWGRGLLL